MTQRISNTKSSIQIEVVAPEALNSSEEPSSVDLHVDKTQWISLTSIYQISFLCLVKHPLSLCLLSPALVSGSLVFGLVIGVALHIDIYTHISSGPFAPWGGIETLDYDSVFGLLLISSVLGVVGTTFANWITIDGATKFSFGIFNRFTWKEICIRFPILCMCILIYGAVITFGAVEINAQIFSSESLYSFKHPGGASTKFTKSLRLICLRIIDRIVPTPQSPYIQFIPLWRKGRIEALWKIYESSYRQEVNLRTHGAGLSMASSPAFTAPTFAQNMKWEVTGVSILAFLFGDIVLRFISIATFQVKKHEPLVILRAAFQGAWFGLRHIRTVITHAIFLRLFFSICYGLLFVVPLTIWEEFKPMTMILPNHDTKQLQEWFKTVAMICFELLNGIFYVFSLVFDANLYLGRCIKKTGWIGRQRVFSRKG